MRWKVYIKDVIRAHPFRSDREISRMLGCSPTTVGKYRDATGLVGVMRSVRRGDQSYAFDPPEIGKWSGRNKMAKGNEKAQEAQPQKQMTRMDKRIIFEKMNEVYINEKEGYSAPWTDEMVAKHLGVCRAWIAKVREEDFGPLGSNSEIDAAVKASSDLLVELVKYNQRGAELARAAETIQKQLNQITKAVRP